MKAIESKVATKDIVAADTKTNVYKLPCKKVFGFQSKPLTTTLWLSKPRNCDKRCILKKDIRVEDNKKEGSLKHQQR